jgi:hypothetical protein
MWGITRIAPPRKIVNKLDKICREEGGHGYSEVNRTPDTTPGINNGRYFGWFAAPNLGFPQDRELASRIMDRIRKETGCELWEEAHAE